MSHQTPDQNAADLPRRLVLRGGAVTGLALPLLVACGAGGGEAEAPATSGTPEESAPEGADTPSEPAEGGSAGLASTSDVPVGGGKVLTDQKIVLTQPTEGEFKAFTAVCTHQQCIVASVSDGTILCPCHGSMYSAEDGSVTGGPAPSPLAEIPVKVQGGQIVEG